jgi:hypothetical protein
VTLRLVAIFCVVLPPPFGVVQAADAPTGELSRTGMVAHPRQFDPVRLRALPSQDVQVMFDTERRPAQARCTGVALWALLGEAGGIDDKTKGAVLRHAATGRDGYFVVLSTGKIAPDFGTKPALIAYQRVGEAPGGEQASAGDAGRQTRRTLCARRGRDRC